MLAGPMPLAMARPLAFGPAGLFGSVPPRGPFAFLGQRLLVPLVRGLPACLLLEPRKLADALPVPEAAGADRVVLMEAGEEAAESAGGGVEGMEMARDLLVGADGPASRASASDPLLVGASLLAE